MSNKHKNKNKSSKSRTTSVKNKKDDTSALTKFNADLAVIALNNEDGTNLARNEEPAKAGSFLASNDLDGYLEHLEMLIKDSRLVTITLDGQVRPFVADNQANAVAALNEPYFVQTAKDVKVDSAIQIEVDKLPAFFIQGNSLINRNVFSDDQIALKSRSWHQLPSPKVVKVIKELQALLPKLTAFKGKIVL